MCVCVCVRACVRVCAKNARESEGEGGETKEHEKKERRVSESLQRLYIYIYKSFQAFYTLPDSSSTYIPDSSSTYTHSPHTY